MTAQLQRDELHPWMKDEETVQAKGWVDLPGDFRKGVIVPFVNARACVRALSRVCKIGSHAPCKLTAG